MMIIKQMDVTTMGGNEVVVLKTHGNIMIEMKGKEFCISEGQEGLIINKSDRNKIGISLHSEREVEII